MTPGLPDLLDMLAGFDKQSALTQRSSAYHKLKHAVEKAEAVPPLSSSTLNAHLEV